MKPGLRQSQDVWAGLMFIGTGAGAMLLARKYPFGTALRMGPGYFPALLGGLLVLFGVYLLITGLHRADRLQGGWSLRAVTVLPLAMAAFGLLMEHAGFLPALVALSVGAAAAGREFRLVEVLWLTVLLTGLAVAVFIWGLGLPYPLIKEF